LRPEVVSSAADWSLPAAWERPSADSREPATDDRRPTTDDGRRTIGSRRRTVVTDD
jgi:hypothetical protein